MAGVVGIVLWGWKVRVRIVLMELETNGVIY
jgi:hypothetical protein